MNWFKLILCGLCFCYALYTKAQCITVYPNTETFESAPTWIVGGSNSDWAWGTPSKATITGAGGGLKCWCIAGLTGSAYNNSEQSYIKSPCYDFSTLTYPYVSFKIFWESEWLYDGGSLQYSINGGTTWITVGAFSDPVNCMTQNWYNKASITYLAWITPTNKNGWAGNMQPTVGSCQGGNGSNGWVTAKHCLNGLAGQSNVIFRFTFGSGTTCNVFDGFAIDDFTIDNAPPNAPAFTYTCTNFTAVNPPCPIPSTYLWNFGDPTSGSANTSVLTNPTHNFSSAGIYTVSLTTSGGACNAPGTITQTVSVLGFSITSTNSVSCFGGNDGSATISAINGTAAYSYTWLPTGGSNNSVTNLTAGIYSIVVKDANGCVSNSTLSITQPSSLTIAASQTTISCFGGNNGSANLTVNGGTGAYTYTWLPNNIYTNNINSLTVGSYTCYINDGNNCFASTIISILQPLAALSATTSALPSCGSSGSASVTVSGGSPIYSYTWLPSGTTTNSIHHLSAGTYSVIISDINSCTIKAVATITSTAGPTSVLTGTNVLCYNGTTGLAEATTVGGSAPYTYTWLPSGGNTNVASGLGAGNYSCTITDANLCTIINTISIFQGNPIIISVPHYSACANQIAIITATASGGAGVPYNYLWNVGGINTPSIHVYSGTTINYSVVATDANGCISAQQTTQLFIYNTLHANFIANEYEVSITDPVVDFTDISTGNPISWLWSFSGIDFSNIQNTSYHFPTDGNYQVQLVVKDNKGCKDSVVQLIKVIPEFTFYVPNCFTPDGNDLNDLFLAQGTGWDASTYLLQVFDRWGAMVFSTNDYAKGWNGKIKNDLAKMDVYTWKAEVYDQQKKRHQYIGHVNLIH